jgi:hypothetical protein
VTSDIAHEVYARLSDSGSGCPAHLRDFIDDNLNAGDADRLDKAAGLFDFDGADADRKRKRIVSTRILQAAV